MVARTLLHGLIAVGLLYALSSLDQQAPPLLALVIAKLTHTPLGPVPAALGFAVGMNNHAALALPAYVLLLAGSSGMQAAGDIAAAFGIALLIGYACRGALKPKDAPEQPHADR